MRAFAEERGLGHFLDAGSFMRCDSRCVRVRVRACVRACVRVRERVRACVHMRARVHVCITCVWMNNIIIIIHPAILPPLARRCKYLPSCPAGAVCSGGMVVSPGTSGQWAGRLISSQVGRELYIYIYIYIYIYT